MSSPRTPLPPREAALRVARRLQENGHVAYFAGGCVRDRLLGIEPEDYDVATDAHPERVCEIFPRAKGVGAMFGVVIVGSGGHAIEVATFRSDGAYLDARRPVKVTFGSAQEDAHRRDFTINGLFEEPETGEVVDLVGGQSDLEERTLRAIGDPEARFEEDHLRMLRAVRFSARFGLTIEESTADAITARASRLQGISPERIGHELRRMFTDPSRAAAAMLIERFGLDEPILGPGLGSSHGVNRLAALRADALWIDALIAWLLDRGVQQEARVLAEHLTERLVFSNQERESLVEVFEIRRQLQADWETLGIAARKRLLAKPCFARGLGIIALEDPQRGAQLTKETEPLFAEGVAPTPLITGGDLLEAGFQEGPSLGAILESVYTAQLEGRVETRQDALDLARGLGS